jgi:hypothetical protein
VEALIRVGEILIADLVGKLILVWVVLLRCGDLMESFGG